MGNDRTSHIMVYGTYYTRYMGGEVIFLNACNKFVFKTLMPQHVEDLLIIQVGSSILT